MLLRANPRMTHLLAVVALLFFSLSIKAQSAGTNSLPTSAQLGIAKNDANKGGLISLNFQNIETVKLLQLLAEASGKNFVISDAVKGSMTLHVSNITWQEALNIVLKANGLGSRQFGNVILIAPLNQLVTNEIDELQAQQRISQLAQLESEVIYLNYANAKDIAEILKSGQNGLLSPRGEVGVETRSNSIWIRDIPSNIKEIKQLVMQLDKPARQVLIEARIVSLDDNYGKDIGARFGISSNNHLSGTLAGVNQINGGPSADGDYPLSTALKDVIPFTDRLNFNLPSQASARPGTIALGLVNLGHKTFLDMELSALENAGHAETISTPRLITSNQQPALIEQGEEIPYLASTSSGATQVEFRKAVLSLKITPQITPDNNIVLTLTVTQNTRGEILKVGSESFPALLPPAIDTKEVTSSVFLKNGQTIILGGIYQRNKNNQISKVPFFGDIPVIGNLFKNKSYSYRKKELLIFVTPIIIDQESVNPALASTRPLEKAKVAKKSIQLPKPKRVFQN